MKKKIISLCLVVALGATAVIGGTLAYFTDTDDATNVITVGNVEIDLTEDAWTAEGGGEDQAEDAYPGEALPKDPTVTNKGANPCFVRIKVEGLDSLAPAGLITYETDYETGKLGEGWVKVGDYFYYTEPLCVAGTEEESWNEGLAAVTTPLFEQIRIPTDVTNGFDGQYAVVVTAEAVQAQGAAPSWTNVVDGKNPVTKMTVEEIAAWFTTCMGTEKAQ